MWLVAAVPDRVLGVVIGVVVLAALAMTTREREVPRNRRTLAAHGVISGTTGTASGIGGPPIALLYQRERPRVRATLALYFFGGALLSLTVLGVAGHLPSGRSSRAWHCSRSSSPGSCWPGRCAATWTPDASAWRSSSSSERPRWC